MKTHPFSPDLDLGKSSMPIPELAMSLRFLKQSGVLLHIRMTHFDMH
jgi:hypothetical protein